MSELKISLFVFVFLSCFLQSNSQTWQNLGISVSDVVNTIKINPSQPNSIFIGGSFTTTGNNLQNASMFVRFNTQSNNYTSYNGLQGKNV
jgi:hypothetical protein